MNSDRKKCNWEINAKLFFKCWKKEKTVKLEFYVQQKYTLKLRQNKNDLYKQRLRYLPPVDVFWEIVEVLWAEGTWL